MSYIFLNFMKQNYIANNSNNIVYGDIINAFTSIKARKILFKTYKCIIIYY